MWIDSRNLVTRSQSGPLESHDITGPPTVVTHEKEDLHSFLLPWTLTRVGHCHPTIFSTGIGFPINSWRAASAKKLHGCKYVPNLWSTGHGLSFDTVALPWLQEKTKDPPPKLYPQKKKNPYLPKSVVRVLMDFMVCDKTSMLLRLNFHNSTIRCLHSPHLHNIKRAMDNGRSYGVQTSTSRSYTG